MPRLVCWSCGRQIYTVAPLESLFAEERRCPRCGAFLRVELRETERRQSIRRVNPQDDPGPPRPASTPKAARTTKPEAGPNADPGPAGAERRKADRRKARRRRDWSAPKRPGSGPNAVGWQD
jgi:DNA-directed RNA polymerase subunit RPC12/RpoP